MLEPLLSALHGFPKLDGAKCRGLSAVFDEQFDPETVEYACHLCAACPALAQCGEWYASLKPSKRPQGTVAGKLRRKAAA
jgi:hypothetical protein